MAKRKLNADEADYVVVASGSAGAAVAGRLAQSGASVSVLEAGQSDAQSFGVEARHDRPDARGAAAQGARRLGALLHAAGAPARPHHAGARHGDQELLKYTDVQNVAVLKKQVMGARPGQYYDSYVASMLRGLKLMRRFRVR